MNNYIWQIKEEIELKQNSTIIDNISKRLDKVLEQYIKDVDNEFVKAECLPKKFTKEVRKWK